MPWPFDQNEKPLWEQERANRLGPPPTAPSTEGPPRKGLASFLADLDQNLVQGGTPLPSSSLPVSVGEQDSFDRFDRQVRRRLAAAVPVDRSIPGEIAASAGRWAVGVPKHVLQAVEFLGGDVLQSDTLKGLTKPAIRFFQEMQESPTLKPSTTAGKPIELERILAEPGEVWGQIKSNIADPKFWAAHVPEAVGSMAEMLLPVYGQLSRYQKTIRGLEAAGKTAEAANVARKMERFAKFGPFGMAMALEALEAKEGLDAYEEAHPEKKINWGTRIATILGKGAAAGALEAISLKKIMSIFGGKGGAETVKNILEAVATEGTTEGAQEFVGNLFARMGYDPDQKLTEGIVEAVLIGAAVGGIAGGVGGGSVVRREKRIRALRERADEEAAMQATQSAREAAARGEVYAGMRPPEEVEVPYPYVTRDVRGEARREELPPGETPLVDEMGRPVRPTEEEIRLREILAKPAWARTAEEKLWADRNQKELEGLGETIADVSRPTVPPQELTIPPTYAGPRPMGTSTSEVDEAVEPTPDLRSRISQLTAAVEETGDPNAAAELSRLLIANQEEIGDLFRVPEREIPGLEPIANRLENLIRQVEETGDVGAAHELHSLLAANRDILSGVTRREIAEKSTLPLMPAPAPMGDTGTEITEAAVGTMRTGPTIDTAIRQPTPPVPPAPALDQGKIVRPGPSGEVEKSAEAIKTHPKTIDEANARIAEIDKAIELTKMERRELAEKPEIQALDPRRQYQPGDKVWTTFPNILGMPSMIEGEVFKTKNGLRVRITTPGVGGAKSTDLFDYPWAKEGGDFQVPQPILEINEKIKALQKEKENLRSAMPDIYRGEIQKKIGESKAAGNVHLDQVTPEEGMKVKAIDTGETGTLTYDEQYGWLFNNKTGVMQNPDWYVVQKEKEGEAAKPAARGIPGATVQAATTRGTTIEAQYEVIDVNDVVTSHDDNLALNPDFPQEFQPRERSRAASQLQVGQIEQGLQPDFLLSESPQVAEGSPIIGPDNLVESGNARTIALRRLYSRGARQIEGYRQRLKEKAAQFGINPALVDQIQNPILVRRRLTDVDRLRFVREANEGAVAAMSDVEQARSDANLLRNLDILQFFVPNDAGVIATRDNAMFVRQFMEKVVGPTEANRYLTAEGDLSQAGIIRIRNALFALAYGDSASLSKLAESPDDKARNITGAMTMMAARLASLNKEIAQGNLHDLNITQEIALAADTMQSLREQGQPVEWFLAQQNLFQDVDPLVADLLRVFDKYSRSRAKITAVLTEYANNLEALGNPRQGTIFGEPKSFTKAELLQAAITKMEQTYGTGTPLFDTGQVPPEVQPGTPGGGKSDTEAAGGVGPEKATGKIKTGTPPAGEGETGAEPRPPEATAPPEAPHVKIAGRVAAWLSGTTEPLTAVQLATWANEAYGGTQAEGKYTPKDAYDALEMGVNQFIAGRHDLFRPDVADPETTVKRLEALLKRLPTQTRRTGEMDEFQQFSTPPPLAFMAAWTARIGRNDVVLEPSAGIGGLAVFAKLANAKKVVVNELSPRRAALLRDMDFDQVYSENAELLNNILPDTVKPTVVLMNPPFSATAGRKPGERDTRNATLHIEQALQRLQPGGRLVAIVGEGMAQDRPAFRNWWAEIKKTYNVLANVGVSGKNYAKYGTTWNNQLLVIDKTGPTPDPAATITGKVENLAELADLLKEVRDAHLHPRGTSQTRRDDTRTQPAPPEPTGEAGPPGGRGEGGPELPPRPATPRMGLPEGETEVRHPVEPGGRTPADRGEHGGLEPGERHGGVRGGQRREPGGGVSPRAGERPTAGGGPGGTAAQQAGIGKDRPASERPGRVTVETTEKKAPQGELSDSLFEDYKPQRLKVEGAKPHPGKLQESAAMAAVEPPAPTYKPQLPLEIITSGKLSEVQLEALVYAGQAHQEILPNGARRGYFIGDGCVAGETRIYDPILNRHIPIEEMVEAGKPITVLALTKEGFKPIQIEAPFFKGYDDLYSVCLDDGRKITVTPQHRFLTPSGWLTLADGLRVGHFLASAEGPPANNLEFSPSIHGEDAHHLNQRPEDCLDDCFGDLHQYDAQLPMEANGVPKIFPLQGGVPGHSLSYRHKDGQEISQEYSHPCQYDGHLSKSNFYAGVTLFPVLTLPQDGARSVQLSPVIHQEILQFPVEINQPLPQGQLASLRQLEPGDDLSPILSEEEYSSSLKDMRLLEGLHQTDAQAQRMNGHSDNQRLFDSHIQQECSSSVSSCNYYSSWHRIVSIEFVRHDKYYDMYVPGAENYVAEGIVNHNTGVGKGREIAGIILDNWNQGRKKAVWVSDKAPLIKAAQRDVAGIGWQQELVFPLSKTRPNDPVKQSQGVMFLSYDLLRSGAMLGPKAAKPGGKEGKARSRLDQIVEWLGPDFDGVIAFDESHKMGNALETRGTRGKKEPSLRALAGIELQKRLPKARVLYVSATGATEVMNLAYAERLGLWGDGTAFPTVREFITQIESAGIAAMELVARDLKALGSYTARSLSYEDVGYDRLTHTLTEHQQELYNEMARAWQIVLQNIHRALAATGGNQDAKARGKAHSLFWASHQRFFNQILTAIQMPSVLAAIKEDLANGRAVVLQLVNTLEASQARELSRLAVEGGELEELDLTPRQALMQYIDHSFPTTQYIEVTDDQGNTRMEVAKDSKGDVIHNREALRMKEELLNRLGALRVPDSPIDMVLNEFGPKAVAEVTGRKRRVVRHGGETVLEKRSDSKVEADIDAFMNDDKQILIFSDKGGTGRSYHADLTAKNQRQRVHYLVQAGWRADNAIQGFGRTHRSNQKQAPTYILVETDLKGQKRFISSIARRLDQLGALTKGQRQAGSGGIFQARDNLESQHARDGLVQFYRDLAFGRVEGLSLAEFEEQTGLHLLDEDGNLKQELPPITQFLNRLLSMEIMDQNRTFDAFYERVERAVENAAARGELDVGVETLRPDPGGRIEKVEETTVYTDPKTGSETKYVQIRITNPAQYARFEDQVKGRRTFYVNVKSGQVWAAATNRQTQTTGAGEVLWGFNLQGPRSSHFEPEGNLNDAAKFKKLSPEEAQRLWQQEIAKAPKEKETIRHLITGVVLPIWDRLPTRHTQVYRLQTQEGERMIGRLLKPEEVSAVLRRLGVSSRVDLSPEQLFAKVLNDGDTLELANGWFVKRRMVSGEQRIELTGPESVHLGELERQGVFTERINYKTRFFIPTDPKTGADIIGRIVENRPVVAVVPRQAAPGRVEETGQNYFALTADDHRQEVELAYGSEKEAARVVRETARQVEIVHRKREGLPTAGMPDVLAAYRSRVAQEYVRQKWVDLTGFKLDAGKEAQQIAELFQVYRNPKMEILHTIYTDANGVILAHNAMTSGQINYVSPKRFPQYLYRLQETARRLGAAKVHVLHNHPSGNPSMSLPDKLFAIALKSGAGNVKGLGDLMGEFVVIDHGKFSYLYEYPGIGPAENYGDYRVLPHLRQQRSEKVVVSSAKEVAAFGSTLKYGPDKVVLVHVNSANEINGWSVHHKTILDKPVHQVKLSLQQEMKSFNASRVAIITDDKPLVDSMLDRMLSLEVQKPGEPNLDSWILDITDSRGNSLRGYADFLWQLKHRSRGKPARGLWEEPLSYTPGREQETIEAYRERYLAPEQEQKSLWRKVKEGKATLTEVKNKLYSEMVDRWASWEEFSQKAMEKATLAGKVILPGEWVQNNVSFLRGVQGRVDLAIAKGGAVYQDPMDLDEDLGMTVFTGDEPIRQGNSLEDRLSEHLRPVAEGRSMPYGEVITDLFQTFMPAQRDLELAGETGSRRPGEIKGTHPEDSRVALKALENKYGHYYADLTKAAEAIRTWADEVILRPLLQVGFLNEVKYAEIKARNEFYVPFKRLLDDVDAYIEAHGASGAVKGRPIQKIKGSEKQVVDPLQMLLDLAYKAQFAYAKNKMIRSVYIMAKKTEDEDIREVPAKYLPVDETLEQEIDVQLRENLERLARDLGIDVKVVKKLRGRRLGQFEAGLKTEVKEGSLTAEEAKQIKVRFATTEKVLGHEIGHGLDHKYNLVNLLITKGTPEMKRELRRIADQRAGGVASKSYRKYIRKREEQVAEFVSRYVNDRAVCRKLAPEATTVFEEFLQKAGLEKLKGFKPRHELGTRAFHNRVWARSPLPPEPGTIPYFRDGVQRWLKLPPDMYQAVQNMMPSELGIFLRVIKTPADLLRAGAILVPEFAVARNPVRDVIQAWTFSRYGFSPLKWFEDLWGLLTKKPEHLKYFQEAAAGGGFMATLAQSMLDPQKVSADTIRGDKKKFWYAAHPVRALAYVSAYLENLTRFSIYKQARKKGASHAEAVQAMRRDTIDFRRFGAHPAARYLNMVIPFWNASIQGMDKLVSELKGPNRKAVLRRLGVLTTVSLLLLAFAQRDDRYEELEDWEKNYFWHIPLSPDLPMIRLPKPFEAGILFGSVPERLVEMFYGKDPKGLKGGLQAAWEAATPEIIPTILRPYVEMKANYDFFRRRPIEDVSLQNLPPELRSKPWTTELAKSAGNLTGISPVMVEHFIRSWSGGLGANYFLPGIDLALRKVGVLDDLPQPARDTIQQVWGVRTFFTQNPTGYRAKSVEDFFETYQGVLQADQGWKQLWNAGKLDQLRDFLGDHPEAIFAQVARKAMTEMAKAKKERLAVYNSRMLTADQKRVKLEALDEKVYQIAKVAGAFMRPEVAESLKMPPRFKTETGLRKPLDVPAYYQYAVEPVTEAFRTLTQNPRGFLAMDETARTQRIITAIRQERAEYKPLVKTSEMAEIRKAFRFNNLLDKPAWNERGVQL